MLFNIKVHHSWLEGPRHALHQVKLVNLQQKVMQDIVWPYVKSSSWYSHSESILQTRLCSSDEEERRFGIGKVLFIRGEKDLGEVNPRPRRTPEINL